jgi:hypothetical protein
MVKRGEFAELLVADAQLNDINAWLSRSPVATIEFGEKLEKFRRR